MADLRHLDGTPLKIKKLKRNEKIADTLTALAKINDRGRMQAIVSVYLTPEGRWEACWSWPMPTEGFPWGMAMIGALRLAEANITNDSVNSEIDDPGDAPPEPEPA